MPLPGQRKVAFSAKQKKEQIKAKRERNRNTERDEDGLPDRRAGKKHARQPAAAPVDDDDVEDDNSIDDEGEEKVSKPGVKAKVLVQKVNEQPVKGAVKGYDPNRYRLHFSGVSSEDVERGKALSREPVTLLPETSSELDLDDVYRPGSSLDMPKRPPWDYSMSRQALDAREETYFKKYVNRIFDTYSATNLSYFELNLETWRQLWRVVEMSDVILLITDIRHPALHFSPALYDYVVKDVKKHLILVLNKVDLAPPSLVVAWKHYFTERFPELRVICFTSFPKEAIEREKLNEDPALTLQKKRKRRAAIAVGPKQLLSACEEITQGAVDLRSWKTKIEDDVSDVDAEGAAAQVHVEEMDTSFHPHQLFKDGMLTIGCCGYPNVGKSSLINGLVGKKVVSVSRTPGHTKHFQTIFLTSNVKLCDSPGLVFPSLVSKPLQVLAGIFPIAQLREPYTTVRFLAERMDLPRLLKLKHPDVELNVKTPSETTLVWSAFHICDGVLFAFAGKPGVIFNASAWAEKRGFLTAKAARNDVYRAANHLLRMASEGRLCLCMKPPAYYARKDEWIQHPDTAEIERLQAMHREALQFTEEEEEEEEEEETPKDEEDDEDSGSGVTTRNPFALLADDN